MLFLFTFIVGVFSTYAQYGCDTSDGEVWCEASRRCCEGGCAPNGMCMGGEGEFEFEDMIPQMSQPTAITGGATPFFYPGEGGDGAEEANFAQFAGHNHDGNGCFSPYKYCDVTKSCYNPMQGQRCPCPKAPVCGCVPTTVYVPTKDASGCVVSCSCVPKTATNGGSTTTNTNTAAAGETASSGTASSETASAGTASSETASSGTASSATIVSGETETEAEGEVESEAAENAAEAQEEAAEAAAEGEPAEVGGLLRQTQPVESETSAPSVVPQLALVSGVGFTAGVLLAFCWRRQTAKPKISFEDFYQDIALDVQ